jgi:transposase InsO family protein
MKTKNEVTSKFIEFKALVENQMGKKIKILRSDNGGEYVNRDLENILKAKGIRHETTVSLTPEQNGVAERKNRTLVEGARSMLIESNLSNLAIIIIQRTINAERYNPHKQ